jgi:hypothetical protein
MIPDELRGRFMPMFANTELTANQRSKRVLWQYNTYGCNLNTINRIEELL